MKRLATHSVTKDWKALAGNTPTARRFKLYWDEGSQLWCEVLTAGENVSNFNYISDPFAFLPRSFLWLTAVTLSLSLSPAVHCSHLSLAPVLQVLVDSPCSNDRSWLYCGGQQGEQRLKERAGLPALQAQLLRWVQSPTKKSVCCVLPPVYPSVARHVIALNLGHVTVNVWRRAEKQFFCLYGPSWIILLQHTFARRAIATL